jgi:hypothetical protein
MTADPEPPPKRKRRTKAEREAADAAHRAELAAQPIDPLVWILLGVALLFVAVMTWLDPVTLANAGNNPSILQFIPVLLIRILGHTPASILLTVLGAIPLVWGIVGWVRKRQNTP